MKSSDVTPSCRSNQSHYQQGQLEELQKGTKAEQQGRNALRETTTQPVCSNERLNRDRGELSGCSPLQRRYEPSPVPEL